MTVGDHNALVGPVDPCHSKGHRSSADVTGHVYRDRVCVVLAQLVGDVETGAIDLDLKKLDGLALGHTSRTAGVGPVRLDADFVKPGCEIRYVGGPVHRLDIEIRPERQCGIEISSGDVCEAPTIN